MSGPKRYRLQFKVIATFVVLALILVGLGLMNLVSMERIQRDVAGLGQRVLPMLQLTEEVTRNMGQVESIVLHHVISTNSTEMRQIENQIEALSDTNTSLYDRLERWLDNDLERRLYQEALEARDANHDLREDLLEHSRTAKGTEEFNHALDRHFAAFTAYQRAVTSFARQVQQDAEERGTQSLRTIGRLSVAAHALIAAGLLIGIIMGVVIVRIARELAESNRQFELEIAERHRAEEALVEAIETTQRRIARDLHDSLVQHLSGIHLLCEAHRARLAAGLPEDAGRIARISELLQSAIAQTRGFARGLSPVEVETRGLFEALHELTERLHETWGIECVVRGAGFPAEEGAALPRGLGLEVATNLYRIAQEALHNALRHGAPSRIEVALSRDEGELVLSVKDNGKGLTGSTADSPGMGLRSMHYRARVIGARLKIQGTPGSGTTVVCAVPISDAIHERLGVESS